MSNIRMIGTFKVNVLRNDKTVASAVFNNDIVDEGKNAILDTMFNAQTQATWYCGLIGSITTLSNSDTMASHSGWTEYTSVDEANRQTWNPDAAASKTIINPQTAYIEYTINNVAGATIAGLFICSNNTLGGITGTLWCTGALSTSLNLEDNDVIQIQYSVEIA